MCGIICVYSSNNLNINIINNISHRGHESYGISYFIKKEIVNHYFKGTVDIDNVNSLENDINKVNPKYYIGHTRYSTSGLKNNNGVQPFNGQIKTKEKYILVHNGNIENREGLKKHFGCDIGEHLTDTQILMNIIDSIDKESWYDILQIILSKIVGVYCLIIGVKDDIYILRDSYGVKPLCYCRNNETKSHCIISENNLIEEAGYKFVSNIKPGTIGLLNKSGYRVIYTKYSIFTPCLFEYIYFLSKKSIVDGVDVSRFRYECGKLLSQNDTFSSINNVVVCGIPETGVDGGIGYADNLNLNYQQVIKKNGKCRTFILKNNEERNNACKSKFVVSNMIKDKIVILIDDSLVRGNTLKNLIGQCRQKGCKEVHIRIVSPPVVSECYFGIDIPTKTELIAHNKSIEEISDFINSDSLKYLDLDKIKMLLPYKNSCGSCFTGNYNMSLLDW